MDDANADQKLDALRQSPGSTIIIRWQREQGTPAPGQEQQVLRGNVLDLSNHSVTPFAGLDVLFAIIRASVEKRPKASRRSRRKWSEG